MGLRKKGVLAKKKEQHYSNSISSGSAVKEGWDQAKSVQRSEQDQQHEQLPAGSSWGGAYIHLHWHNVNEQRNGWASES